MVQVKAYTYHGLTHKVPKILLPLWKKFCCTRRWHCFDEVGVADGHYFSCDACGLSVRLGRVSYKYADGIEKYEDYCKRIEAKANAV